ncbi:MAG: response regulator [Chromatiales bacterium]|jgi:CheY-like chemotaxis protein|nr:response regulator [Chromatiales bacterium]MDX9766085.1 response regulator [Ectothiorhodospiraceae bacterium]
MNAEEPCILVATEIASDAEVVRRLLTMEFERVFVTTSPENAVADFEHHKPQVLVLAFNTLEKAERYYLGLYRLGHLVHALPHRTVILCNKDDLKRVYDLCKQEYFDDYVLFWPTTNDSTRLRMAVHHALRQMAPSAEGASPSPTEFAAQARRIAELETLLERSLAQGGQRIEAASHSLQQAEQGIGTALEGFSRSLSDGTRPDLVEVRDRDGFQREVDRIRREEIGERFRQVTDAVQPVRQWVGSFKEELKPQLESARALGSLANRVRSLVLLVDDDEFQHKLLKSMLKEQPMDLVSALSGTEALAILRRQRPDIILMDVNLPDIDGVEATHRLKAVERFANTPVIMVTGHSERKVVFESLKAGAVDFVVKPFDRPTLIAKLHTYLQRQAV